MRLAIPLLLASAAFAQNSGSISGKVVGLTGDPVANARIQLTNVNSKAVFSATTEKTGVFSVDRLPAGTYDLAATQPEFNAFSQPGIRVAAAQSVRLDIRMFDYQLDTLGDGRDIRAALLTEHSVPKGATPRTAAGKPDLSGMWHPLRVTDPGKMEPLPWAAVLMKERSENNTKDSPFSQCLPRGVALIGGLYPFKVVQTPAEVFLLFEDWVPSHREIFMDGRAHPKDAFTWMGHAVGRWEGDTLVVDRAGFNDTSWIDTSGRPHTDKLRVTERFRRPDLGHLEIEMTFDDPGAYARPWTIKGVFDYAGDDELQEFICNENNKDLGHMVGR